MYTVESRIRYSEIDHTGQLRLSNLVNYFQDCSTFQSEDLGYSLKWLREQKRAWILQSWQIKVERYPRLGEKIKTETWSNGFDLFYGTRNFRMKDEEDKVIAYANSIWIYIDTESGRPVRIQESDVEKYGQEPALEMEKVSRKIRITGNVEKQEGFYVRRDQIDTNEHVNNSCYIQMAAEAAPECEHAGGIRVEYKRSAVLGDYVIPGILKEKDRNIVTLSDANEDIFATVEFKEK